MRPGMREIGASLDLDFKLNILNIGDLTYTLVLSRRENKKVEYIEGKKEENRRWNKKKVEDKTMKDIDVCDGHSHYPGL